MADNRPQSDAPTLPAAAFAPTLATPPSEPGRVDPAEAPLEEVGRERYAARAQLGAGGMGEVLLCKDERIGREVALKVARAGAGSAADAVARFVREARVQGQLEHPAIVPVYDLGRRADGGVYFTMKRVRGLTLEAILAGQRAGDAGLREKYSRRKLLTAFLQVAQAIDFAHTRGVLHRDLKPANVMLGDFGEVYVLDWGLARVAGVPDPEPAAGRAAAPKIESGPGAQTTSGAVMGTPGYMPPEQLRGETERLDARADVYALGAVLFEILAGEPLHPRASAAEAMASTLAGAVVAGRGADVPPELEAAVARAVATDPADRFASARALCDAVERYLDGDRDLARRRELADAWAAQAAAATERALGGDEAARRAALADAGRALALDPGHAGALRAMMRLMVEPPRELPRDVKEELAQAAARTVRLVAGVGGLSYLSWLLFLPFLAWMGVRDAASLWAWAIAVLGMGVVGFLGMRVQRAKAWYHFGALVLSNAGIVLASRFFGPYVMVPALAAVNTVGFLLYAPRSWRWGTLAVGAAAVVLPALFEVGGVFPRTTTFTGDAIVVADTAVRLPETATTIVLLTSVVAMVVVPGLFVGRVRDALAIAEERLQLHSWHLRQMIPDHARGALAPQEPVIPPLLSCRPLE